MQAGSHGTGDVRIKVGYVNQGFVGVPDIRILQAKGKTHAFASSDKRLGFTGGAKDITQIRMGQELRH
jgi:hypothetical protein